MQLHSFNLFQLTAGFLVQLHLPLIFFLWGTPQQNDVLVALLCPRDHHYLSIRDNENILGKNKHLPEKRLFLWKWYSLLMRCIKNSQLVLSFRSWYAFIFHFLNLFSEITSHLLKWIHQNWSCHSLWLSNSERALWPYNLGEGGWQPSTHLLNHWRRWSHSHRHLKRLKWTFKILHQLNEIFCTWRVLFLFHLRKYTLHIKISYSEVHYFQPLQWYLHPPRNYNHHLTNKNGKTSLPRVQWRKSIWCNTESVPGDVQ